MHNDVAGDVADLGAFVKHAGDVFASGCRFGQGAGCQGHARVGDVLQFAPARGFQTRFQGNAGAARAAQLELFRLTGFVKIAIVVKIGRRDHDLIARFPIHRLQQTECFAARRNVIRDFRPRHRRGQPIQLERATHDQDSSSAHAHVIAGGVRFGQGDGRFFRERLYARANPQSPVKHDAGCIQLEVLIGELELAEDRQVFDTDVCVEHNRFVGRNGDVRSDCWNRATPSQRIAPFGGGNDIPRGVRTRIVDVRAIDGIHSI